MGGTSRGPQVDGRARPRAGSRAESGCRFLWKVRCHRVKSEAPHKFHPERKA
jgi:hypothetical protein